MQSPIRQAPARTAIPSVIATRPAHNSGLWESATQEDGGAGLQFGTKALAARLPSRRMAVGGPDGATPNNARTLRLSKYAVDIRAVAGSGSMPARVKPGRSFLKTTQGVLQGPKGHTRHALGERPHVAPVTAVRTDKNNDALLIISTGQRTARRRFPFPSVASTCLKLAPTP